MTSNGWPVSAFLKLNSGSVWGASRTRVREALFRLRNEGFLNVEAKLGWFVQPIDFDKLDELCDLRIVLDLASVARRCEPGASTNVLNGLARICLVPQRDWLSLGSQDAPQVGAIDEQFHATLVRSAGSAEMVRVHCDMTERIRIRIRIVRRLDLTRADRIAATYTEHAAVLRAVLAKDQHTAQQLLQHHIQQSKVEVRQITLHMLHQAREQRRTS